MDVSVGVLVVDNDRILLVLNKEAFQKTLPSGKSFHKPGKWGLPGGRRDPEDKDHTDTAMRETREETGLFVEVIPDTKHIELAEDHLNICFAGYPVGGSLQPCPEEILDCRWVPVKVLRNPELLKKILHDESAEIYNGHLRRARRVFEIFCMLKGKRKEYAEHILFDKG